MPNFKKSFIYAAAALLTVSTASLFPLKAQVTIGHSIGHYQADFYAPVISHDQKYMATTGDNRVKIWDTRGNLTGSFIDNKPYINPPNKFKFWKPNRSIYAVAFLPDNRQVAVSVFPRRIYILDLTGRLIRRIKVPDLKLEPASGVNTITKILYFPDGKNILTFESAQYDIVIRDHNFKAQRRIDLRHGNYVMKFTDIKISPRGKYFVVAQNHPSPSQNGWNSVIRLYDRRGNFIRDLETDRPGRIKTAHGRLKKYFFKPEKFAFSPDGKYIAYLKGTARVDDADPLNRTYKRKSKSWKNTVFTEKYKIRTRIRKVNISTGRQYETLVLHESGPLFKRVFFSPGGNEYIGLDNKNIYRVSMGGEVKAVTPHQKIKYVNSRGRKYQRAFSTTNQQLLKDGTTLIGRINSPFIGMVVYNTKGKLIKALHPPKIIPKNVYISHKGRYLSFELERARKSILWDTKTNRITTESGSIYFDNWNKPFRFSHNRKSYTNIIEFNNDPLNFKERENRYNRLIPYSNRQYADITKGFTLFNNEGDAIRRYPKAHIRIGTTVHPSLKYYINPDTSSKYKTVNLYNLQGKEIRRFYLGAFFSFTYCISPGGKWILAGHDAVGYIQIWNPSGTLLHRITDQQSVHVTGLDITKNKRFLLSSGADGTIKLLDLKTRNTLRITLLKNNGFIVSDTKGRFDCSNDAASMVSIVKAGVSRTKKLWNRAHTPGLIGKFLRGR